MSILLGIFLLILGILTLLAPKDFLIERTTTINKPIKEVFDSIKLLKNHEEWNSWSKKDPNLKNKGIRKKNNINNKYDDENKYEDEKK